MWEKLVELDRQLFIWINNSLSGRYEDFWLYVTEIYTWIPLYIIFFVLFLRYLGTRRGAMAIGWVMFTAFCTLTLTNLVKNLVARLRPNNEPILMDSAYFMQAPTNFSFWSGHSATSMAVTVLVIQILSSPEAGRVHRWYYLFLIWPLLFAISRIFVGVHYPMDVIVGCAVGAFLGFAFAKAYLIFIQQYLSTKK